MSIGKNIAKFRKAKNLTQAELGELLGVTNQAVSKWEMDINMPDVMLLPELVKVLGVTFNQLYGIPDENERIDLPWENDGVIRGVVFEGRKLLTANDGVTDKFTFEIVGNPQNVHSECNVMVHGSVMGRVKCVNLTVTNPVLGGMDDMGDIGDIGDMGDMGEMGDMSDMGDIGE